MLALEQWNWGVLTGCPKRMTWFFFPTRSKPLQETELRKLPLESLQAAESVFCCVGWPWKLPEMDIYMQLQRQVLRQPWECTSRSGSSEEHFLVDSPSLRLLHFEMTLTSALRGHETTLVTTPFFPPNPKPAKCDLMCDCVCINAAHYMFVCQNCYCAILFGMDSRCWL